MSGFWEDLITDITNKTSDKAIEELEKLKKKKDSDYQMEKDKKSNNLWLVFVAVLAWFLYSKKR